MLSFLMLGALVLSIIMLSVKNAEFHYDSADLAGSSSYS